MIEAMRNPPPAPAPVPATNAASQAPAVPKNAGLFAPAPATPWAPPLPPGTNPAPAPVTPWVPALPSATNATPVTPTP
jgi:hypothetical protein